MGYEVKTTSVADWGGGMSACCKPHV